MLAARRFHHHITACVPGDCVAGRRALSAARCRCHDIGISPVADKRAVNPSA
nr:hypothetical protein [Kibdelosporangium sp. MJ126-NF4]CTQ95978.1 hypothetical protein [Kibdelosporangium sp. MJ126-NF4]